MRKLSVLFGDLPMSWPAVCISAAVIGAYVGNTVVALAAVKSGRVI